ncbi:hypothetical protein CF327_g1045 [Tilletia walkeri]|uniref:Uncharacterized protein n=1 Tax=Tilletia walkeri TaxID=117179 RepID=A0A8X7NEI9_9BASI|nr:hypothetical protein CF327_g1045 [Tilletia walkeri]KAE8271457.1 hypothetical protein A4X09_0g883 [Tilletia walkeri]
MSSLSPNAAALLAVIRHGRRASRPPQVESRSSEGAMDRLTSALLAHGAHIALQAQAPVQQQQQHQQESTVQLNAYLAQLTSTMETHRRSLEAQQSRIDAVAQGIQSQLALMNQTLANAAMQHQQQQLQARAQASGRSSSLHRRGSSSLSARRTRNMACAQAQAHERITVGSKRSHAEAQEDSQPPLRVSNLRLLRLCDSVLIEWSWLYAVEFLQKRRMLLEIDPPQTNGSL